VHASSVRVDLLTPQTFSRLFILPLCRLRRSCKRSVTCP